MGASTARTESTAVFVKRIVALPVIVVPFVRRLDVRRRSPVFVRSSRQLSHPAPGSVLSGGCRVPERRRSHPRRTAP